MSYQIYKLTHYAGLFLILISLGAYAFGAAASNKAKAMGHGIGLVLMLVGGFGMLARLQISWPFPGWAIGKVLIWLAFGGSIAVFKRRLLPPTIGLGLMLVLGLVAAGLAIYKPF